MNNRKSLLTLIILFFSLITSTSVFAQEAKVVSAGIGFGYQNGGSVNPNWIKKRLNGNPIAMMGEVCQSQRGKDLLNLGVPSNGQYIGWCNKSPDGNVYRCDGDGDPSTVDDLCANWSAIDCKVDFGTACALATPETNGCDGDSGGENMQGNPCNVATGNKYYEETLFTSGSLTMNLSYNSNNYSLGGSFGYGWSSNYNQLIYFTNDLVHITEGNGRGEIWQKVNDIWVAEADSDYELTQTNDGFLVKKPNGDQLFFEQFGSADIRLISKEVDANGNTVNYDYTSLGGGNYNLIVTDEYGGHIEIKSKAYVKDGNGNIYYFTVSGSKLNSITYPGITNGSLIYKSFHYENSDYPFRLTGITDENRNRYATYAYDSDGKAITTEHAQTTNSVGQERFQFGHQGDN